MTNSAIPETRSRHDLILIFAFVLIGLVTRLPFAGADEGWYDELFSLFVVDQSFGDVMAAALIDQTNPPGFYLLAHLWGSLGDGSLRWQRTLTCVAGALTSPVVFATARRLGLPVLAAAVAAGITLASPLLWQMSLEVRSYAPLALLSAVALWGGSVLVTSSGPLSNRLLLGVGLTHVLMVMFHYFGAFSVLGLSIAVVLRTWRPGPGGVARASRLLAALGAPAAVAVAAWLVAVYVRSRGLLLPNVAWIPETGIPQALRGVSLTLLGNLSPVWGRPLSHAVLALAPLVVIWQSRVPTEDRAAPALTSAARARFLIAAAIIPPALVLCLLALDLRNFWVDRYMAGMLPALALLPATALTALRPPAMRVASVALLAWTLTSGALIFVLRSPKPDWTTILSFLAPHGEATICTGSSFVALPLIYHVHVGQFEGERVVSLSGCAPGRGPTWLVYDVEPTGITRPPTLPGAALGPRIVLFRGVQNLDARLVVGRSSSQTATASP
ncbi:MAG: hypothetical protein ACYC0B_02345 [Gemmatimonadaceae bacterium]